MSQSLRTVSGTVGPDTEERLEGFCEERGISKSMAVRRALRQYLEEQEVA